LKGGHSGKRAVTSVEIKVEPYRFHE
jgi:hypothetical protein